jgi:hypothetical protein
VSAVFIAITKLGTVNKIRALGAVATVPNVPLVLYWMASVSFVAIDVSPNWANIQRFSLDPANVPEAVPHVPPDSWKMRVCVPA